MYLKQSTAVTVSLGPFVDDTDGKTAETGLSLTVYIIKNGATATARNSSSSITHDRDGYYRVALDTADTGTLGRMRVLASPSGALPVWRDMVVLAGNVYDSLVGGTDLLDVDATTVGDGAIDGDSLATSAAVEIAGAVWDEALGNHLAAGSSGEALDNSGGGSSDPWTEALPGSYANGSAGWILGTRLDGKVSAVSGASPGAGAVEFAYTLTDAGTGDPVADADVWATTDAAGSNVVASGRTDQNGVVTFYLDAGTVYIWRQKSGWNFANPDSEMVA